MRNISARLYRIRKIIIPTHPTVYIILSRDSKHYGYFISALTKLELILTQAGVIMKYLHRGSNTLYKLTCCSNLTGLKRSQICTLSTWKFRRAGMFVDMDLDKIHYINDSKCLLCRVQQNLVQAHSFVNTRQYSPLNLTSASLRNDSSAFVPVKRGVFVASSASSLSCGDKSYTDAMIPSPSSDKSGPLPGISSFVTSTPVHEHFQLDPHLFDTLPGHGYSAEELQQTNIALKRQVVEEEQNYKDAVVEDMSASATPPNPNQQKSSVHVEVDEQSNAKTQTTASQKDAGTDNPLEVDGSSNGHRDSTSLTSNYYINLIIFSPSGGYLFLIPTNILTLDSLSQHSFNCSVTCVSFSRTNCDQTWAANAQD